MKENTNVWMWIKVFAVLFGVLLFLVGMVMDFQSHPASDEILKGGIILVIFGFLTLMAQVKDEDI